MSYAVPADVTVMCPRCQRRHDATLLVDDVIDCVRYSVACGDMRAWAEIGGVELSVINPAALRDLIECELQDALGEPPTST